MNSVWSTAIGFFSPTLEAHGYENQHLQEELCMADVLRTTKRKAAGLTLSGLALNRIHN